MTLSKLFAALDMETAEDLEYFEQFADLMEMDEDISFDVFYAALSGMNAETAGELAENYFEDLAGALPDDENDMASLVDSVEQNLLLLASDIDRDEVRRSFAQQLYKFRTWYKDPVGAEVDGLSVSPFTAVVQAREDKLAGGSHDISFSGCSDYDLDDASYGLGRYEKVDVVKTEEDDNE